MREAMYRAMTGGRSPHTELGGERAVLGRVMDEITRATGGTATGAARATGVSARAWSHWRSGDRKPTAKSLGLLRGAQRRLRASSRKVAGMRSGEVTVAIHAVVAISSDVRDRVININRWLPANRDPSNVTAPAVDAWLRGDDAGAVAPLMKVVDDHLRGAHKRAGTPSGGALWHKVGGMYIGTADGANAWGKKRGEIE